MFSINNLKTELSYIALLSALQHKSTAIRPAFNSACFQFPFVSFSSSFAQSPQLLFYLFLSILFFLRLLPNKLNSCPHSTSKY